MFQVKNKVVLKMLASRQMKKNRQRNMIGICAIILTSVLFSALFTLGGGMMNQMRQIMMSMSGSTAHASIKYISMPEYEKLETAGGYEKLSYMILTGMAVDERLEKLPTEVRYGQDEAAKVLMSYPTKGRMPQGKMEIALSDLVLEKLGLPEELGQEIVFPISVDGTLHEDTFTLCGIWKGDSLALAQQAWVSREYSEQVAPVLMSSFTQGVPYEGTIAVEVDFSNSRNVEGKLTDLIARAGLPKTTEKGINPAFVRSGAFGVDLKTVLVAVIMLMVVLLSGYLIIYNVFYISVTQDIQFYGLLKTIGASGKQLRRIVYGQAARLSLVGIPVGLFFGYGIGKVLLPIVSVQFHLEGSEEFSVSPLVLFGGAFFSLLTIWISCMKPGRIAAKVSPIDAVNYIETASLLRKKKEKRSKNTTLFLMAFENVKRDGKKAILVVLSLALSLILLNGTYTVMKGFDLEKYVTMYTNGNFEVKDWSVAQYGIDEKNLEGIDETFLNEVEQMPGLENVNKVYCDENHFITLSSKAKRQLQAEEENSDYSYAALQNEEGNQSVSIYGVTGTILDKIEFSNGKMEKKLWESGEYVIYNDFYAENGQAEQILYKPGDKIILTDMNGQSREFTVMAIGKMPWTLTSGHYFDLNTAVILPEQKFFELYGDKQPMSVVYNVDDEHLEAAEILTEQLVSNSDKVYTSKGTLETEFKETQRTYTMIGGVLSAILAAIGILNFVNVIVTGIISRQNELAMLNAIGMSGKQMKKMLIWESGFYIGMAVILSITFGNVLIWGVCQIETIQNQWAFHYQFTIIPILICLPLLLMFAFTIPLVFYKSICKKSVVERLRVV